MTIEGTKVYDSYYKLPDEERRELLTLLMTEDDDGTVLKIVARAHGLLSLFEDEFTRDEAVELAVNKGFDVYDPERYDGD